QEHAVQGVLRPGRRGGVAARLLDQVLPGRVRGARATGPMSAEGGPRAGLRHRPHRRDHRGNGPGPARGARDRPRGGSGVTNSPPGVVTLTIDGKEITVPAGTLII